MRVEERGSVKLKGKRVNESLAVPDLQGGKLLSCCELGILSEISLARNAARVPHHCVHGPTQCTVFLTKICPNTPFYTTYNLITF